MAYLMEQSSMSPTLNRKEFIKVPPHLKQIDLFVLMRFIISKTAEKNSRPRYELVTSSGEL